MATYVVGDIQGCYRQLQELLEHIDFHPARDRLWSVGDLVNRGPDSLAVLRFFQQLGAHGGAVLGNHDMHLLAVAHGNHKHLKPQDTLDDVLRAPDRVDLLEWLRHQPLLHEEQGIILIHAGLPPQWDKAAAVARAREAEAIVRGPKSAVFMAKEVYGGHPDLWDENMQGWERIRYIISCFTRLRYCAPDGRLRLKKKYAPQEYQDEDVPWFAHPQRLSRDCPMVFGHWATLGFQRQHNIIALDTGCLWGGALTALRLDDSVVYHHPCPGERKPGDFE